MDGILEDAGLVFNGHGIIHEDDWMQEEFLSLDEQQALMSAKLNSFQF